MMLLDLIPWRAFIVAAAVVLGITATAGAVHLIQRRRARRLVAELNAERVAGEQAAAARKALGLPDPGAVDDFIETALRYDREQAWLRGEGGPPWEQS
ncbi:hypothetical protein [Streptosporangium sp. NPDC051022]|uniref:hypothetical protein n=1 Tax=Streptosporangium sp. NPDC051022 TaxID=3155752 RepID=UPI00343ED57E